MNRLALRMLYKIFARLGRLERKMVDLDTAVNDTLELLGGLPDQMKQAISAAVTAANLGDIAQLQAALQHQQNVADQLEQGVAAFKAAFNADTAPVTTEPITIPPSGAPMPGPVVVTDSTGTPVNGAPTSEQSLAGSQPGDNGHPDTPVVDVNGVPTSGPGVNSDQLTAAPALTEPGTVF